MSRRPRRRIGWLLALPFVLVSIVAHLVALLVLGEAAPWFRAQPSQKDVPIQLVILQPPAEEEEEVEEPEEEKERDFEGQIVETAPPEEEVVPEEADYLAEHDNTVEEETRSEKFEVNPEVLAKQHSKEQKLEMEDLVDLNVEKPSTGATAGTDRFDPNRHGNLAALPSPWEVTNKEGTADPVPSSHSESALAGAPQNDLLNEKRGDATNLNTKEFLFASYINRIRRQVNFYWQQNIDNLPRSVVLAKPRYKTTVKAILDSDGALELVEVTEACGSKELDEAVVGAFRIAGPFPNPPEGLIEKDGRVYLPDMSFTVVLGHAENQYEGIDPRAGVQFPGILKSPR